MSLTKIASGLSLSKSGPGSTLPLMQGVKWNIGGIFESKNFELKKRFWGKSLVLERTGYADAYPQNKKIKIIFKI